MYIDINSYIKYYCFADTILALAPICPCQLAACTVRGVLT